MTLSVCLTGKDGIVVASDSRGTFGDPRGITAQNDTIKKVYLVGNVGISVAGAQNTNLIIEDVDNYMKGKTGDVTTVMNSLRDFSIKRFNEWFGDFPHLPIPGQNPGFARPQITMSVAGYGLSNGVPSPRLYSLLSVQNFAPNLHDFGFVLLGVPQYAVYLLNRLYSSDMAVEELEHLAAYVISETASQDGKVGGPIQMAVITPQSSHTLNTEELLNITTANEQRTNDLKQLFKNIQKGAK